MKIRKRITCLTLALAVFFGLVGLASAQEMGDGMADTRWITGSRMSLSPEKQAVVQRLYSEHHQATIQLRQQLFVKHSELNAQLYGGNTDDMRVQVLTREISDLNARLFENQVKLHRQLVREGVPIGGMGYGGMGYGGMGYGGGMGGYGHHGMGY